MKAVHERASLKIGVAKPRQIASEDLERIETLFCEIILFAFVAKVEEIPSSRHISTNGPFRRPFE